MLKTLVMLIMSLMSLIFGPNPKTPHKQKTLKRLLTLPAFEAHFLKMSFDISNISPVGINKTY